MSEGTQQETPGVATNGEPRSAEEIRAEIEQTREQLGETVEALAEKTDVQARTQERIDAARETVSEKVSEVREAVTGNVAAARSTVSQKADEMVSRAREVTPESAQAGLHQAGATIQERPLPYATIAAFAAGLLIGWMIGRR